MSGNHGNTSNVNRGAVGEVWRAFSKLGLTSFGGPIAHLVYFRREFVEQRKWLSESQYAQLLALCQFLPGPASSQLGFVLGLQRAGWTGALAAFLAFTLPSALLLFAFAALLPYFSDGAGDAAIHGLKLVALCVVAQGVVGMMRQLCPDAQRKSIAALAVVVMLLSDQSWMQLVVIATGAIAGWLLCRNVAPVEGDHLQLGYGPRLGSTLLAIFVCLLIGLWFIAEAHGGLIAVAEAFYRSGALVFGGGHVVLPLLEQSVVAPGWVSRDEFLAGYGAAQAVPGPMFTLSAYLGARLPGADGGLLGAGVALSAIFLPGFLLVTGMLPIWGAFAHHTLAARLVAGINAAVVGLLAAALYDPVWTTAVRTSMDLGIAVIGFTLLMVWRISPLLVVAWCVFASILGTLDL